jgi:acyl carrier protein
MRSLSILMDVEAGVIEALKNVSRRPIQPVPAQDLIADLGFDSLQVLELVADLEDRFDITIPVTATPAIRTVAEVIAAVSALVEARAGA